MSDTAATPSKTGDKPWLAWIGRSQTLTERLAPERAAALHATLDRPGPPPGHGAPLPPLWHWIYFWEPAPASALGRDGHPALGGFLPPVPLERRMWAGSRLSFHRPLTVGSQIERVSTITAIDEKSGRTGNLAFVTVEHRYMADGDVALVEEHDIVYREPARPGDTAPPGTPSDIPEDAARFAQTMAPNSTTLFRYSALTLNGHRIHYDHPYATGTEGYRGLVVHGPLLATLMATAAAEDGALTRFSFRGRRPVICGEPFRVIVADDPERADRRQVRIIDQDGFIAQTGVAGL